jgi:RNA polymerase primary sigma factor
MTLEVIGTRMGVTRERVRQIKEQALSRLRQAERARSLASFFA